MKYFLYAMLGGLVAGFTLFLVDPPTSCTLNWTEEQKVQGLCGGFTGVIIGFWVLVLFVVSPFVGAFS